AATASAFPSPAAILRAAPLTGMSVIKGLTEAQMAQLNMVEKQLQTNATKAGRLGSIAGTIQGPDDWDPAILQGLREGVIDAPMARYLRDHGYDANLVSKFQNQALTVQQQHEAQLKNLQEARTTLLFGPQFSEAQNKARREELATAGQTIGSV